MSASTHSITPEDLSPTNLSCAPLRADCFRTRTRAKTSSRTRGCAREAAVARPEEALDVSHRSIEVFGVVVSAETAGTSKLIGTSWGQVAALGVVAVAIALPLVWTEALALLDSSQAGSVEATASVVADVPIEESVAGSGSSAAGDATPVEAQGNLRASVGGLEVIVRDEHGPVEGAELWFVTREALERADKEFDLPVAEDILVEIERLGQRGVSDSAGRFRFPWGEAGEGVPVRQFFGAPGEAPQTLFQPRASDSNGEPSSVI